MSETNVKYLFSLHLKAWRLTFLGFSHWFVRHWIFGISYFYSFFIFCCWSFFSFIGGMRQKLEFVFLCTGLLFYWCSALCILAFLCIYNAISFSFLHRVKKNFSSLSQLSKSCISFIFAVNVFFNVLFFALLWFSLRAGK